LFIRPRARPPVRRWPYRGKDLHEFLHRELRLRYPERLGSFDTDLAAAPWWFWAPDL